VNLGLCALADSGGGRGPRGVWACRIPALGKGNEGSGSGGGRWTDDGDEVEDAALRPETERPYPASRNCSPLNVGHLGGGIEALRRWPKLLSCVIETEVLRLRSLDDIDRASYSGDKGDWGTNDVLYDVRKEVRLDATTDSRALGGPSPNLDNLKVEPGIRDAGEMRSDTSSSLKPLGGVSILGRGRADNEFVCA